jgi:RNA polymerase sigma-70 factor (ECF subfamily)
VAAVPFAAAGDEVAFSRIVGAYHDDMCRVAYVICHDTELAHEAVQQAWEIAWRRLRELREHDRIKSWLIAIAANEARQVMRRQRRRVVVEQAAPPSNVREGSTVWTRNLDLRSALTTLSPEDRELLALRYVAGIDSTQLSQITGLSPSGTRARLQRILATLRSEIEHADA